MLSENERIESRVSRELQNEEKNQLKSNVHTSDAAHIEHIVKFLMFVIIMDVYFVSCMRTNSSSSNNNNKKTNKNTIPMSVNTSQNRIIYELQLYTIKYYKGNCIAWHKIEKYLDKKGSEKVRQWGKRTNKKMGDNRT